MLDRKATMIQQQQLSDNEKSLIGNTVYDLDKYDNANYRDPKDKRPYR